MSEAKNQLAEILQATSERFNEIASSNMSYAKEQGFALQLLSNNDYLYKAAMSHPPSLQRAIINVAAVGLSLNPAEKLAYLIPRNSKVKGADGRDVWQTRVYLEPSYMGLCKLATDCGTIEWIQAKPVHASDSFVDNGLGILPTHKYEAFKPRGDLVGVYCVARMKSGEYLTEIMDISQVNDIRDRSESFKKGYGAWVTDYIEQAKKTVVRRAYKMWPRSAGMERLSAAVDLSNDNEGFQSITTAPNISQFTGDQKTYFDSMIEKSDALSMYVFSQTIETSVMTNLYHSFGKGQKGKYQRVVDELMRKGEEMFNNYKASFAAMTENEDDSGANELIAEMPQDAINLVIERSAVAVASFLTKLEKAA